MLGWHQRPAAGEDLPRAWGITARWNGEGTLCRSMRTWESGGQPRVHTQSVTSSEFLPTPKQDETESSIASTTTTSRPQNRYACQSYCQSSLYHPGLRCGARSTIQSVVLDLGRRWGAWDQSSEICQRFLTAVAVDPQRVIFALWVLANALL